MQFPSLPVDPAYPLGIDHVDNSLRAEFQAGYEVRRPRYSRPKRKFKLTYKGLTTSEKNTLESFFNSVGTGTLFQWTYPNVPDDAYAGTVFEVYFDGPPSIRLVSPNSWQATFTLVEV